MQVIKQTITVPATRELHIQLPESASAYEQAEIIVLFKTASTSYEEKCAAMLRASSDEMFLADLNEVLNDFEHTDAESHPAWASSVGARSLPSMNL